MKNAILGLAKRVNDMAKESGVELTVDEVADITNSLHKVIYTTISNRVSRIFIRRKIEAAETSGEKWSIIMRNMNF